MNAGTNTTAPPFNRITGRHRAAAVTSPTRVIGNINQGFEENSVQFQPERASLPKSISIRSSSYFKMNAGRNTTAPSSNRITTDGLRAAATPFFPRTSLRVHMPTLSAVDEKKDPVPVELDAYVQGMYKTELCNKWVQTGVCRYGDQCQFADGFGELRPVVRHPRYKTEVCREILNGGFCPYDHRCHFRRVLTDQEKRAAGITCS
ncbi:zinc finger CCCH domain-containing protein 9-like [Papaver somniferum]|uniref:zinc finger CCCH domain-containing protein 9-like n=1 Tax=Papaver somniferum TaxID=3469 RepID=UPI000E6FEDC8|nr:zinc finger CCCH domain-containing protein 9-like [Papaver somniferum]